MDEILTTGIRRCEHCDRDFLDKLRESNPELFTKKGNPRAAKWQELKELERSRPNLMVPCMIFTMYDDTWGYDEVLVVCKKHFKKLTKSFVKKLDSLET